MGGYIPPAYITISWLAKRGSVCLERNKAINFFRGQGVGEGERRAGAGGHREGGISGCCVQSAISLMKWSTTQGKPHGGGFRKRKARMPFVSVPSGFISLLHFISEI